MINAEDRSRLLVLARRALEAHVCGAAPPDVRDAPEVVASGVFVTIHWRNQLRGCLGSLDPGRSLAHAIARLAADVSDQDYRFRPVTPHEVPELTIDLSVLTSPEPITDIASIEVGRDGLIVQQGRRRGLLLPQVATEHGWDREMLLRQTCVKAGLKPDAWQHGATVQRFQAEVFGEK